MLAYSGGLDTSVILKWLVNKGFDVIAYVANALVRTKISTRSKRLTQPEPQGVCAGPSQEFVTDYIFKAAKANAVCKANTCCRTSIARPLIAKYHIEVAKQEQTKVCRPWATGKATTRLLRTRLLRLHARCEDHCPVEGP